MSDEFKKKLAEIASRVEASKQKTSNAAAEKAADVAKVKAVIADWKKRIVPSSSKRKDCQPCCDRGAPRGQGGSHKRYRGTIWGIRCRLLRHRCETTTK